MRKTLLALCLLQAPPGGAFGQVTPGNYARSARVESTQAPSVDEVGVGQRLAASISLFGLVKAHYDSVGKQLALDDNYPFPVPRKHKVLVLVSSLGRGTVPALAYARALSDDAEAVHIELDAEAAQALRAKWERWGAGVPLVILPSPYRSISEPLVEYLDRIDRTCGSDTFVTIVIPEFVTKELWHIVLHNQTAFMLRALLRFRKGTIVTSVRFYLDE